MSMDRKNKKAAQVAAGAANKDSSSSKPKAKREQPRNPLVGLSNTSSNSRAQGRPPITMQLKASMSAPAAALEDPDFASFGDNVQLPTAPALATQSQDILAPSSNDPPVTSSQGASSGPVPVSSPRRPNHTSPGRPPIDFGPIGSPPRSAGLASSPLAQQSASPSQRNLNGTNFLSTSPFSAPGPQSMFISYAENGKSNASGRPGIASSLGSAMALGGHANGEEYDISFEDYDALSNKRRKGRDVAVEDGDLEDFLPSSLTDLLTPEERSRRMSRSNSGQGPNALHPGDLSGVPIATGNAGTNTTGHRYSRSVPAPSLLGDISSIWASQHHANNNTANNNTSAAALPSSPSGRLGLGGTPSSFTSASASAFGGRFDPLGDDLDNMLNPTNASAAFLPNLHHQYLNAKANGSSLGRGIRNSSNPLFGTQYASRTSSGANTPSHLAAPVPRTAAAGVFGDASSTTSGVGSTRPLGGAAAFDDTVSMMGIISPGTRALQNHAPGQSLPQGLAAGYSRIHALPPLPPLASPSGASAIGTSVSPGLGNTFASSSFVQGNLNGTEWGTPQRTPSGAVAPPASNAPTSSNTTTPQPRTQIGGSSEANALFNKVSYSAAASRGSTPNINSNANSQSSTPAHLAAPPGITRNVSGGRWGASQVHQPLSPLSGGVVAAAAADDDDLFSMDAVGV